jgi:riboflavin-specific deaminase-like protein
VAERPYLLVSCAMSVDGYIDDTSPDRLILSSEIDADRVDEVRAGCDAILVGARTVRRDNPRLLVRSPERRIRRVARGAPENPVKVTITASGNLDPAARFFTGNAARLVYCARPALATLTERLSGLAEVVDAGDAPSPALLAHDLAERGLARVLLEGGGDLATQFLAAGLADELHLVIAPFFVGDPAAPRFALPGRYPHGPDHPMQLAEIRQLGDVVLLRYLLGTRHPVRPPAISRQRPADPGEQAAGDLGIRRWPSAQPSRAGDARIPADPGDRTADDIRWLRRTIDLLSADEPPPPGGEPRPPVAETPPPAGGHPAGPGDTDPEPANRPPGRGEPGQPVPSAGAPPGPAAVGSHLPWHTAGPPPSPPAAPPPAPAAVDIAWLRQAIELSWRCPPSQTAYSVGAIIVAADGTVLATGFSRETGPHDHAEEVALAKMPPGDSRLPMATLYSSLEPCGVRSSRPCPCSQLIIAAGLRRVVYAWREPPLLAAGGGGQQLRAAGVIVIEVPELAPEARRVNAHIVDPADPSGP